MPRRHTGLPCVASRAVPLAFMLMLAPLIVAASPPPRAAIREPTDKDLSTVRERIAQARGTLVRLTALPADERRELERRVQRAEETLGRYQRLAERGKARQRTQGTLYTAGVSIVFNDVSGVGAIDDALLPLIAVGLLATHLLTQPPPAVPELAATWHEVVVAMEAVGQGADQVRKEAARKRAIPAREDCDEHAKRCLETPLGKRHSGSTWNFSTCADCLDACHAQRFWPDTGWDKKSCRWWEFLGALPPGSSQAPGSHP
jgi:hypothetical protein